MILRPMTMADADKMLEWKNYPETRQFAIASHDEIKKEDHYKWLENNLQYFQIIYSSGYMGVKRGDPIPPDFISGEIITIYGAIRIQDNEISIWIDRKFRDEGIATDIIEYVSQKGMIAKIVEGNIASMKAFIRAGFEPVSYQNDYYVFKKV